MYFVKFTIKNYFTKEEKIKKTKSIKKHEAEEILDNYIKNVKNYFDIKFLGNNKIIVKKNGGEIKVEIKKREAEKWEGL